MGRQKIDRLFVIERVGWNFAGIRSLRKIPPYLQAALKSSPFSGGPFLPLYRKKGGAIPVKAYLDRALGEAHCQELNDSAWSGINPFHYGTKLGDWTSLDAGRLCDWLIDHGLEPPQSKVTAVGWRNWYDKVQDTLDALQCRAIRVALDGVKFYRVAELTE